MIDYIRIHELKLGPVAIQPFGLLVALGFLSKSTTSAPGLVGSLTLTQCGFAMATLLSLVLLVWMRWTMHHRPGVP